MGMSNRDNRTLEQKIIGNSINFIGRIFLWGWLLAAVIADRKYTK